MGKHFREAVSGFRTEAKFRTGFSYVSIRGGNILALAGLFEGSGGGIWEDSLHAQLGRDAGSPGVHNPNGVP